MPTVLRIGSYRFHFYANDRREPPHVHLERGGATAKFWLNPVRFQRGRGFGRRELNRLQEMVERHEGRLQRSWNDFFKA